MSWANAASSAVEVVVRHTTKLAATSTTMRTARNSPPSKPSAVGEATTANTTANAASTITGTSGTTMRRTGMRAAAASTTTTAVNAAIPHHVRTKKIAIEYTSSATIFTRASHRCTTESPAMYVNPWKFISDSIVDT